MPKGQHHRISKKTPASNFSKVTYDDLQVVSKTITMSKFALNHATEAAKALGISRTRYIELALTSANAESKAWEVAAKRYDRVCEQRFLLKNLKKRITWQKKAKIDRKDSRIRTALEYIVNNNVTGTDLKQYLEDNNMTIGSNNE